jgi:hypothetical protein
MNIGSRKKDSAKRMNRENRCKEVWERVREGFWWYDQVKMREQADLKGPHFRLETTLGAV